MNVSKIIHRHLPLPDSVRRYVPLNVHIAMAAASMCYRAGMARCLPCNGGTGTENGFSDGMSLLRCVPPPPIALFPASYKFTTGQMAVIWEVLR